MLFHRGAYPAKRLRGNLQEKSNMLQRDPLEKVRARTQQGLVLLTDITPTVSIFGSAYITRQHIPHPPDRFL